MMAIETKKLTEEIHVRGQISVADIEAAAKAGFKSIINNRPDIDAPGQPTATELEAKATKAGLEYKHIPVIPGQLSLELVQANQAALQEMPGPILAFCASGTRSTILWCCANVKEQGVDAVLQTAADAGYQLQQIRPLLGQIEDAAS